MRLFRSPRYNMVLHFALLVALNGLLLATAAAAPDTFNIRRVVPQRSIDIQNAQIIPQASFVSSFSSKVPRRAAKKRALLELRRSASKTSTIIGTDDNEEYATSITVGGQNFEVIDDTGSSDLFLPQVGFQCFSLSDASVPEADCFFCTAGFDPAKSRTFKPFNNMNFNITFADQEFLTGGVGFDTVSIGGLSVAQQEFGVVTKAAWNGDGVTSGLVGFAFPGLTSVFNGSNPDLDVPGGQVVYQPFFFKAVEDELVQPFFSVTLDRGSVAARTNSTLDPHLGFLALGGIPPVAVTGTSATVPIQGFSISSGASELFFYDVDVDKYTFPGSAGINLTGSSAILDTGTTLNLLPTPVANAYNAAFDPPGQLDPGSGLFLVDCSLLTKATNGNSKGIPPFSVVIGGKVFQVDGRDNVLPAGTDENGNEVCISGVQDGGPAEDGNIFILGDVFLHNVVSTFDVQRETITLHERAKY
ncbi:acid protease [Irpex rosettiformis]|uniref:Acid protease n=1 Tax=Irpex rosettiformis TaxID=378272 RepID=A0ACB8TXF9_9APHY|nr:acid protease [Irpex rosettiformis]